MKNSIKKQIKFYSLFSFFIWLFWWYNWRKVIYKCITI